MIKPNTLQSEPIFQRMELPGTDLTILVTLENGALTMLVSGRDRAGDATAPQRLADRHVHARGSGSPERVVRRR